MTTATQQQLRTAEGQSLTGSDKADRLAKTIVQVFQVHADKVGAKTLTSIAWSALS